jgi:hypothetical protein
MLKKLCLLVSSLLMSTVLFAQSTPPGEGPWRGVPVWFGAEFSTFNPDYGCANNSPFACWNHHLAGVASYVYANNIFKVLGVEGEARILPWGGPGYLTQSSLLAGPRLGFWRYKRFLLDGKVLLGEGRIVLRDGIPGSGYYFAYAPGLVLDYRVSHRLSARFDYEYQRWPSFKGGSTGAGGLTPNGLSFGVSYMLLR